MPGPVKTEAVVLRSMRYGEADRILHLYTPHRGRVSAIAKGVRRARSRFGGRLEPFFRLHIEMHEGRGELLTVTGAQTIDGHARLRGDARALDAAARACDAVGRLFETSEPHPGVFNLLCRQLALLDARAGEPGRAAACARCALAFRLKLLLAAGLAPQLAACANCGEHEHLVGFSGAAGGVVCAACEAGSFPLEQDAYRFMTEALGARADRGARGARAGARAGGAGDRGDARASRAPAPDARGRPQRLERDRAGAWRGGGGPISWSPWTRVCRSHTGCWRRACRCLPATASRSAPFTTWWRRRRRTSSTAS